MIPEISNNQIFARFGWFKLEDALRVTSNSNLTKSIWEKNTLYFCKSLIIHTSEKIKFKVCSQLYQGGSNLICTS
jgi:hypothetical protein